MELESPNSKTAWCWLWQRLSGYIFTWWGRKPEHGEGLGLLFLNSSSENQPRSRENYITSFPKQCPQWPRPRLLKILPSFNIATLGTKFPMHKHLGSHHIQTIAAGGWPPTCKVSSMYEACHKSPIQIPPPFSEFLKHWSSLSGTLIVFQSLCFRCTYLYSNLIVIWKKLLPLT